MKKFEYRTEQFDLGGFVGPKIERSKFDSLINGIGAEGWELVSCSPIAISYGRSRFLLLVFKKEVEG